MIKKQAVEFCCFPTSPEPLAQFLMCCASVTEWFTFHEWMSSFARRKMDRSRAKSASLTFNICYSNVNISLHWLMLISIMQIQPRERKLNERKIDEKKIKIFAVIALWTPRRCGWLVFESISVAFNIFLSLIIFHAPVWPTFALLPLPLSSHSTRLVQRHSINNTLRTHSTAWYPVWWAELWLCCVWGF